MNKSISRTGYLTRLSVLLALVFLLTLTGIGNIPFGTMEATIYHIPVIVGAVLLGTKAGCILGGIWGILCFLLALFGRTTDVVALTVIQQNPLTYFIIAFVPRLMVGLVSGLLSAGFKKIKFFAKYNYISFGITGAVGALTNTVLYLGALYILVKQILAASYGIDVGAVGATLLAVASSAGLLEAAVSCVLVAVICKALSHVDKGLRA